MIGFIKVAKSFSGEFTTIERIYFLRRYHCNKFAWIVVSQNYICRSVLLSPVIFVLIYPVVKTEAAFSVRALSLPVCNPLVRVNFRLWRGMRFHLQGTSSV